MKLSTETASTNLSGLNWNWTQLASFRAENDVASPYVRWLIIVCPTRRREPCFFTLKFRRSRPLLAVTLNWTSIFITLTSGISLSTYIKTVYWPWVTLDSQFSRNFTHDSRITIRKTRSSGIFLESPVNFPAEKPFQKTRTAHSRKLAFYYDFKIRKGNVGNYSTRNRPRKFREFRETGPRWGYQFTNHDLNWTLSRITSFSLSNQASLITLYHPVQSNFCSCRKSTK